MMLLCNKDVEEQKELMTILNVEKGQSVMELTESKKRLEKELLFVNYGLKLRQVYPSMKALKLIKSVIPEDKIGSGLYYFIFTFNFI